MTRRIAILCAPAVLVASAIAHATGGGAGPVGPAVVAVGEGARVATGFVVAPGRVVTVAHAVPRVGVTVRRPDGVAVHATLLRRDELLDLAVLAVPGIAPAGMPGAGSGTRVRGGWIDTVVVRRADATVRAGDGRTLARRPVLELRADVRAGDSGAPVVIDGRVAGVVFARSRARDDVAWAVDAAALAGLLR